MPVNVLLVEDNSGDRASDAVPHDGSESVDNYQRCAPLVREVREKLILLHLAAFFSSRSRPLPVSLLKTGRGIGGASSSRVQSPTLAPLILCGCDFREHGADRVAFVAAEVYSEVRRQERVCLRSC